MFTVQVAELVKKEALKDDHDDFVVAIGSPVSMLDYGEDANANIKVIIIENFCVSAGGKKIVNNAELKITHRNRYGLLVWEVGTFEASSKEKASHTKKY